MNKHPQFIYFEAHIFSKSKMLRKFPNFTELAIARVNNPSIIKKFQYTDFFIGTHLFKDLEVGVSSESR